MLLLLAGASPVYTVAAWAVQPSAAATYVIEYNNDILLWSSAAVVTYSYLAGFNADAAWSTAAALGGATQYANPPAAKTVNAIVFPSFGITLDTAKNARYSFFHYFRGGNTFTLDLFDIAGGATGLWTANIVYGNSAAGVTGVLISTGSCGIYDGATILGRYGYINHNGTVRNLRYDVKNRILEPWNMLRYTVASAVVGQRLGITLFVDGTTKISALIQLLAGGYTVMKSLNQR
jgi:hypothetical protein